MELSLTQAEADDVLALLKDRPELQDLANRLKALMPALAEAPATSGFKLGATSLARLKGVHPDLVRVVKRAIELTKQDFTVLEGLRSKERQKQLVAKGASKTMNSYHITGHAVDVAPIVNGQVSWDWKYYYPVRDAMKAAAKELGVKIEWGGDWKSFKDGPHFQIPR